jgi:alkaline phosphatase D
MMRAKASRRDFLWGTGAFGLIGALPNLGCALRPMARRTWKVDPFSLGVAAGSPTSEGFVIWTRLAPEPLSPDPERPGGLPAEGEGIFLHYEVAGDPAMRNILRRDRAYADPLLGYSVHVEVKGLTSGRPYWYRFVSADVQSRIGTAITLAQPGDMPDKLRIGFVSCSHYEQGYFSAYRHLSADRPDLVLYLGDYIYEYIDMKPGTVRKHADGVETATLPTYRNRYAQYRQDADLQRLHADSTALVTWDDHEVQNDYADYRSQTFDTPHDFLLRRAAAYQAFYEHMPLPPSARPSGPAMALYNRFTFGGLAEFNMLDGRQYRSREACYGPPPERGRAHPVFDGTCPERLEAARSMLGRKQEAWLAQGMRASQARWNFLGQNVMVGALRQKRKEGGFSYWSDDWNGYPAARQRLLQDMQDSKLSNPVVLTGDFHSYWVNDLKLDFENSRAPVIATEFVGTSITAKPAPQEVFEAYLPDNPHVRFFESRHRGYGLIDVQPARLEMQCRVVSDAKDMNATVSTLKSFVVEDGRPGAVEA